MVQLEQLKRDEDVLEFAEQARIAKINWATYNMIQRHLDRTPELVPIDSTQIIMSLGDSSAQAENLAPIQEEQQNIVPVEEEKKKTLKVYKRKNKEETSGWRPETHPEHPS